MTWDLVADKFAGLHQAWTDADQSAGAPVVLAIRELVLFTITLGDELRPGTITGAALEDHLTDVVAKLAEARTQPNPWAELTTAITLTDEALAAAWQLK